MKSESNKPIAGRVAEHNFWPAERHYSIGLDTTCSRDLWDPQSSSQGPVVLGEILTPERVKVPLLGRTSREVIGELIEMLVSSGELSDGDEVLSAMVNRERTRSTGIGRQVAIPHAKTSQVSRLIMAVGLCAHPVDFGGGDQSGVRLVVMLISPEHMQADHIRVLRRVTDLMGVGSVHDKLLESVSPEALYDVIRRHEVG
ncbi:MAG: PTS sugar transporter subunit IIA [Phycisphaerales bacterium]|jgi:mannitol/fructose-specific phosphotransferase system IIA component (Ntr-type)|nr:PTS sugar transporter subunit IIA [Phycisphaerales bacterium]